MHLPLSWGCREALSGTSRDSIYICGHFSCCCYGGFSGTVFTGPSHRSQESPAPLLFESSTAMPGGWAQLFWVLCSGTHTQQTEARRAVSCSLALCAHICWTPLGAKEWGTVGVRGPIKYTYQQRRLPPAKEGGRLTPSPLSCCPQPLAPCLLGRRAPWQNTNQPT